MTKFCEKSNINLYIIVINPFMHFQFFYENRFQALLVETKRRLLYVLKYYPLFIVIVCMQL